MNFYLNKQSDPISMLTIQPLTSKHEAKMIGLENTLHRPSIP